jgi:nitrate reductase NapE component
MALRITRGLFRLWLVLSVLWVGGVGVVTWRTYPVDLCVTPPGELHFCDENDVVGVGPNFGPRIKEPIPPDKPQFDPTKPYRLPHDKERHEAIQLAVILAIIPPALVLAFGSALIWAFRGFR